MPDGSEGETDIFSVWECNGLRFAVHVENKPVHGKLEFQQASSYRRRAAFKANSPEWLSYVDFETILLAPKAFMEQNAECAVQFDRHITYEEVEVFVPLMGEALREAL